MPQRSWGHWPAYAASPDRLLKRAMNLLDKALWEFASFVVTVVGLPLAIATYLAQERKMVIFDMPVVLFERAYFGKRSPR